MFTRAETIYILAMYVEFRSFHVQDHRWKTALSFPWEWIRFLPFNPTYLLLLMLVMTLIVKSALHCNPTH